MFLKDKMGVKDEKLWYFVRSVKNPTFRAGSSRKTDIKGYGLPIKGGLGQFSDLRMGGRGGEGGGVFEGGGGGGDTPMHTTKCSNSLD